MIYTVVRVVLDSAIIQINVKYLILDNMPYDVQVKY